MIPEVILVNSRGESYSYNPYAMWHVAFCNT